MPLAILITLIIWVSDIITCNWKVMHSAVLYFAQESAECKKISPGENVSPLKLYSMTRVIYRPFYAICKAGGWGEALYFFIPLLNPFELRSHSNISFLAMEWYAIYVLDDWKGCKSQTTSGQFGPVFRFRNICIFNTWNQIDEFITERCTPLPSLVQVDATAVLLNFKLWCFLHDFPI